MKKLRPRHTRPGYQVKGSGGEDWRERCEYGDHQNEND